MRAICAGLIFSMAGFTVAQDADKLGKRYGVLAHFEGYSQKTPQDALKSVVSAIENKRIDYLVAHLADPTYVDRMIADYKAAIPRGGDEAKTLQAFDRLVKETAQYFIEDPSVLRELRLFAKEGKFETMDNAAVGTVKSIDGRKVFLKKIDDRWFLENKQQ